MELQLHAPEILWRARRAELNGAGETLMVPPGVVVTALVPVRDPETREIRTQLHHLPCRFAFPMSDEQELLQHPVEFKIVTGGQSIGAHALAMMDCIPLLRETVVEWRQYVANVDAEVSVKIPVSTNRRPREVIENVLVYRDRVVSLTQTLALHKDVFAVGLLPPIIGCFVGVIATTPLWIPFTLFIAILGFPFWLVLGIGASLVLAISAISTVVTMRMIRSKRIQSSVRELCQSPGGQYVLFANAGNKDMPSPSELAAQAKAYVMAEPSRKLLASLLIDFIGNATFVAPGIGELADVFWAPASAGFVSALYSESSPSAKYFAFIEEFLPFTDFIPTATLAWMKENLSVEEIRRLVRGRRLESGPI